MGKMLAPNVRADFLPEDSETVTFADKNNPTVGELNNGINFSLALTTSFTAKFVESDIEPVTTIKDYAHSVVPLRNNYEVNASFFLDTELFSDSSRPESVAYSNAEVLFGQGDICKGYWILRTGYKYDEPFAVGQEISLFYVENDLPKLNNEERIYTLDVSFISKGFALNNYKLIA